MFGKKKNEPEPSPRDAAMNRFALEVEQLTQGQSLIYKLPEFYWSGFAAFLMVDLNPSYPQKGRKYIMSTDGIADGKPAGLKKRLSDSNKPKDVADWVVQRKGERFG